MVEHYSKLVEEVAEISKELMGDEWNVSEADALKIAVQIQKNRILSNAYGVLLTDEFPAFLEAMAIAQGYESPHPVASAIETLSEQFNETNTLIRELIELKYHE